MPTFTPVDFDPFTPAAAPPAGGVQAATADARSLTIRPASQTQPGAPPTASASGPTFTPVDYDPFASDGPSWLDTAKDVVQSAATGIERGAIGMATLPVSVEQAAHGWLSRNLIGPALDAALGPAPDQPPPVPDSLHDVATNTGDYVGPAGIARGLEAAGAGPMYQPQTRLGRYAETVGEFVPGAPGGAAGLAKYALAPGIASEAAGELTQGTAAEPYARTIAPILAGGAAALAGGPGAPGHVLRGAAGGLDQATLHAAQQLMDAAARQGAPLSLAEAVQQVTNSGTRLGSLQRVVEQSRGGAETMAKFYADRPDQVRQAGNAAVDRVGPVPAVPMDGSVGPVYPNPTAVGPAVQRAAQGALDATPQGQAARQAVTDAGPRVTPEQAGQVMQPGLRQVYDERLGARSAQADVDYAAARNAEPGVDVGMLDPQSYVAPRSTVYRHDAEADAYAPHTEQPPPATPLPLAGPDASGFIQADPRQVVADIDQRLASAKGATATALRKVRGMLFTTGGALDTSVAGLGNVREQIGTMMGDAVRNGDGFTASRLAAVRTQLDDTLSDVPAYATATRNFRDNSVPLAPFENTPALSAAIERDPYNTRFTAPADRVPGMIDKGGPSAARAFNDVAPDPSRQAYESHLTTRLLDAATNPQGTIDPAQLAGVVRDNADTLRQFPAVQARMQRVIDAQRALAPLADTMVGRLAATREFREQAAIILDPSPVPGSAHEVGQAVRLIAAQSPDAARALVSQRIRQVFDEATQTDMSGPSQWGGAKFNAVVRGNDQQARNLKAAVEALHGPGVWRDFQQTLDVFEAMGRRQAPGSMTEPNRLIVNELKKGGLAGEIGSTALSPSDWLGKASEIYDGWRYGRNTKVLADMLTRPDAAKALAAIAKAGPTSSRAQGLAAVYLLNTSANQGRQPVAK